MSKIDSFPYPTPIPAKISGCFLWSRSVMLESAESEVARLISREIIFTELQPIWSRYLNVTDRQTDGRTTCLGNTALRVASRGKNVVFRRWISWRFLLNMLDTRQKWRRCLFEWLCNCCCCCCCCCWSRWWFLWCQFSTRFQWYHTCVQVYWCDYRWVISYRGARKTRNGEVMCALDQANETLAPSSQQDCSLKCGRDDTCKGINIKNSSTCDLYYYQPKMTARVSGCSFYQVATIWYSVLANSTCSIVC